MKTLRVEVGGKQLPCRLTMGAMLAFKRETGKDLAQMNGTNIEDLLCLMWCCISSACRADGIDFDLDFDDFCDHVTPDDLNHWNSLMATDGEDDEDEAKKKKP